MFPCCNIRLEPTNRYYLNGLMCTQEKIYTQLGFDYTQGNASQVLIRFEL